MAIQQVQLVDGLDGDTVHIFGEPVDVNPVLKRALVEDVLIAGYSVLSVADAQHDGHPALRFSLSADNREIGRLVVMTGVATEYAFEFEAIFVDSNAADAFVDEVQNPPVAPKVAQVTGLDFAFDGNRDEELAKTSAKHGVSLTVTDDEGPGGGWPVVKMVGLMPNVLACLTATEYGWGIPEDEAKTYIEAVSA